MTADGRQSTFLEERLFDLSSNFLLERVVLQIQFDRSIVPQSLHLLEPGSLFVSLSLRRSNSLSKVAMLSIVSFERDSGLLRLLR